MDILPLRFVHDDDLGIVGREVVDLAAIGRLGFPVADGLVVFAPEIPINEVLKSFRGHDNERFEQSLTILKTKLFTIEPPTSLEKSLKKHHLSPDVVWHDCLNHWLETIRSRVWRSGLVSDDIVTDLPTQPVFFINRQTASGRAYFDSDSSRVVIEVSSGELEIKEQDEIENLVGKLKRKILADYVFDWVVCRDGVFITRTSPLSEVTILTEPTERIEIKKDTEVKAAIKKIQTSIKIFADLSEGLILEKDADGVFLDSAKIETDDKKILKLVEGGLATSEAVIFQLSDLRGDSDVGSTLRLIHQPEVLGREVRNYLFAKHNYTRQIQTSEGVLKQSLLHLQLGLPVVRSVLELKQMKVELKKLGVERRGNQKLWVEFSVPENWINLEEYLKEGMDGVVINVLELYCGLIGVNDISSHPFYKFEAGKVVKFLEQFMEIIKKAELRILFKGEHVLDDEIIKFALKVGLSGVILNHIQIQGAREYIAKLEKHHILDRQVEI